MAGHGVLHVLVVVALVAPAVTFAPGGVAHPHDMCEHDSITGRVRDADPLALPPGEAVTHEVYWFLGGNGTFHFAAWWHLSDGRNVSAWERTVTANCEGGSFTESTGAPVADGEGALCVFVRLDAPATPHAHDARHCAPVWLGPRLVVDVVTPRDAVTGRAEALTVEVVNAGAATRGNVSVIAQPVSERLRLEPPIASRDLGPLDPGESARATWHVRALRTGEHRLVADAVTRSVDGDVTDRANASWTARPARAVVTLDVQEHARPGERVPVTLRVLNAESVTLPTVSAHAILAEGWRAVADGVRVDPFARDVRFTFGTPPSAPRASPVEHRTLAWNLGPIPPGREAAVAFTAIAPADFPEAATYVLEARTGVAWDGSVTTPALRDAADVTVSVLGRQ